MEIDFTILCPNCGNKDFNIQDTSNPPFSYAGAVCNTCQYVMTANDIDIAVSQAKEKLMAELVRSLGDSGFKFK